MGHRIRTSIERHSTVKSLILLDRSGARAIICLRRGSVLLRPPLCCARCSSGAPGPEPASAARSIIRIALCARSAAARMSASAPCSTWGATSRSSGHWAVLCSRIQQLLDRQAELVPLSCPEEVERHAQRIARSCSNSAPSGGTGRPDLQTVDVGSLELIRPRSVGVEHVGLWAMERSAWRLCWSGWASTARSARSPWPP